MDRWIRGGSTPKYHGSAAVCFLCVVLSQDDVRVVVSQDDVRVVISQDDVRVVVSQDDVRGAGG